MKADVVVVGGGLAGCAAAIRLATAGRQVLLLEKDTFPRDKLCGEFLSGEAREVLQTLGVLTAVQALDPPSIAHARFTASTGPTSTFALPAPAWGVSRWALDKLLFERALVVGADARTRTRVVSIESTSDGATVHFETAGEANQVEARWVVVAHGRRGELDRIQRRSFFTRPHPYMGLKQHHRARSAAVDEALRGRVELHVFAGGYLGMSHVEGGRINVCSLVEKSVGQAHGFDLGRIARASNNSSLVERLEALEPDGKRIAVAEVPLEGKEVVGERVLYAGDAAGMVAPLAGDGQVVALSQGSVLGALLATAPVAPTEAEREHLGRQWQGRVRRGFAPARWVARGLQAMLLSPAAPSVVSVLGRHPAVPQWLARTTRVRRLQDDSGLGPC